MRRLTNTYIIIATLAIFAVIVAIIQYQGYQRLKNPQNYQECTVAPGAIIQESYPEVCRAPNGQSFTRPLTPQEEARLHPPTPTPSPTPIPWPSFTNQYLQLDYPQGWIITRETASRITIEQDPDSSQSATIDIAINNPATIPPEANAACTQTLGSEATTLPSGSTGAITIYLIGQPDQQSECQATPKQIVHFSTPKTSKPNIQIALTYFLGVLDQQDIDRIFDSISLNPDLSPTPLSQCLITGCNNEICASEEISTPCEYFPQYSCYQTAACERQPDGRCGWTPTQELTQCLQTQIPANL